MNIKTHPIGLSDRALALVQRHAMALPVEEREPFWHDVFTRLGDKPSDAAVVTALNVVLDRRRKATIKG